MKRPYGAVNPETGMTSDLIFIHHAVESITQDALDILAANKELEGIDLDAETPDSLNDKGFSMDVISLVAAYSGMQAIHDVVHDMMRVVGQENRQATINDVSDPNFKKLMRSHVPNGLNADVPQAFKDEINKVLGRE